MKFISLCSGIEAASVAFTPLGWEAVAFSEIEKFPSAVLGYHYPSVPNLGDMNNYKNWSEDIYSDADAIVGGPPCQAFSFAGLRNGLNDPRGNLTLTFVDLINHADNIRKQNGKEPTVILYENVPGLLSDKTNAFGCFLGALAGESTELNAPGGKWPNAGCVFGPQRAIAWRILDAQYFGVAQRRRRVFVVASARDGFDPTKILFESEGLRRDTPPSRNKGEISPTLTKECTGVSRTGHNEDGWYVAQPMTECVGTLCADDHKGAGNQYVADGKLVTETHVSFDERNIQYFSNENYKTVPTLTATDYKGAKSICYETHPTDSRVKEMGEVCQTMTSRWGTGGGNVPLALTETDQTVFGIPGNWIGRKPENGGNAVEPMNNIAPCLTKTDIHGVVHPVPVGVGIGVDVWSGTIQGDFSATLTTNMGNEDSIGPKIVQPVAYSFDSMASNSMKSSNPNSGCREVDLAKTLDTSTQEPNKNQGGIGIVQPTATPFKETADCLTAAYGTKWNGNASADNGSLFVMQPTYALQGSMIGRSDTAGPQGDGVNEEVSFTLTKSDVHGVVHPTVYGMDGDVMHDDLMETLTTREGDIADTSHMVTVETTPYSIMPMNSGKDYKARETDISQPLMAGGPVGGNQGGDFLVQVTEPKFVHENERAELRLTDVAGSLTTGGGKPGQGYPAVVAPTLTTNDPSRSPQSSEVTNQIAAIHSVSMAVRRLTPTECERLQGFPDGYTMIPYGKNSKAGCPDGPRYKALGNSWAVPVVRWIGVRIQSYVDNN